MDNEQFRQLLYTALNRDAAATEQLLHTADLTPDQLDELHLYLKAKAAQNPHAIYLRALTYTHGLGVKQNESMAFLLMREAAAKGVALAIYEVGRRFLYGVASELLGDELRAVPVIEGKEAAWRGEKLRSGFLQRLVGVKTAVLFGAAALCSGQLLARFTSASTAGRVLPSRNSRKAPPPVEI